MAEIFAATSVALITGGMVVYEALASGIPAVVFPQEKNLIPETRWLASKGAVLSLGFDGGMDMNRVSEAVSRLLDDKHLSSDMSQRQRSLIDGRGMARAAKAISELLE